MHQYDNTVLVDDAIESASTERRRGQVTRNMVSPTVPSQNSMTICVLIDYYSLYSPGCSFSTELFFHFAFIDYDGETQSYERSLHHFGNKRH